MCETVASRGFKRVESSQLNCNREFKMPSRATKHSAGYDIYNNTGSSIILEPYRMSNKIPTGVIAYMMDDEFLSIHVRSGHGFKYGIRLANSTGIIDADYNKEIFIKIRNPYDTLIEILEGESLAQAVFCKYLKADDDSSTVGGDRIGGFGSTNSYDSITR